MALGARSADVLRMVAGSGLRIALTGIAIGLGGAAAVTHLLAAPLYGGKPAEPVTFLAAAPGAAPPASCLAGLLYGLNPADPVTFLAAPLVLAVVALAACAAPAWRASRVDPAVALRQE